MFEATITVRFGDIDTAGIVYYPRFFHYYHVVYEQYLEARGIALPALLKERHLGFPVVHLEADYKSPLRYGDVCPVELTLTRLGGSSVSHRYRIFKLERDDSSGELTRVLAAEARIVTACMDLKSQTGMLIPTDIRAIFERDLVPRL